MIHASCAAASATLWRNRPTLVCIQPGLQLNRSRCTTGRPRRVPTRRASVDLPAPLGPRMRIRLAMRIIIAPRRSQSHQPQPLQTRMPVLADDDVVVHRDAAAQGSGGACTMPATTDVPKMAADLEALWKTNQFLSNVVASKCKSGHLRSGEHRREGGDVAQLKIRPRNVRVERHAAAVDPCDRQPKRLAADQIRAL